MKQFGTVKSFDEAKGQGSITPETGGQELRFERSALSQDLKAPPSVGQRLSYELSQKEGQQPSAVNLETV
jgi:CspA family cold shock protein